MVLKGLKCLFSPVRTYVVVVGMLVSAALLVTGVEVATVSGAVVVALGTSSSSSGLLNANGIFIDTPRVSIFVALCTFHESSLICYEYLL